MILPVTRHNYPTFLSLWEEFTQDQPEPKLAMTVTRQLLAGIMDYPDTGVALLDGDRAGLLWVQASETPWDPARRAIGWGTYVRPTYRRTGIAKALWEVASRDLKTKGFQCVILSPLARDLHVINALYGAGFRPYQVTLKKDL